MKTDIVIIGAGPAGIFTAIELIKKKSKQHIVIAIADDFLNADDGGIRHINILGIEHLGNRDTAIGSFKRRKSVL